MNSPAASTASPTRVSSWWIACLAGLVVGIVVGRYSIAPTRTAIGATATVIVQPTGLEFTARVDTGAAISSLHCTAMEIADAAEEPEANSGKAVRLQVVDSQGQERWLEAKIVGFAGVRNSATTQNRYQVRLRLECRGITKETLVSLNDRSTMKYPLLLGRDFLQNDFVVDVSKDNPDWP